MLAHRSSAVSIYWHLDDQHLGETSLIHQLEFLAPEGNILEKAFEVVEN